MVQKLLQRHSYTIFMNVFGTTIFNLELTVSDKWHGGKGSQYRKVDQKKYNENWERVFGNKNKDKDQRANTDLKFTTAEEYMNNNDEVDEV